MFGAIAAASLAAVELTAMSGIIAALYVDATASASTIGVGGAAALALLAILAGVGLRRRSRALAVIALVAGTALVVLAIFDAYLVSIMFSSNVSCSEPSAPADCDEDTGYAVGMLLVVMAACVQLVVLAALTVAAWAASRKLLKR